MEEAIKKVEKLINRCNECDLHECMNCEISWTEVQAIKNLIKGYRELEKKNKYWNDRIEYAKKNTKGLKMYEMGMAWEDMQEENEELRKNYINPSKARISYYDTKKGTEVVIEGFIPKSKVKEMLKELLKKLDEPNNDRWEKDDDIYYNKIKAQIRIIQELMEDK